jgi:hypothetical protein
VTLDDIGLYSLSAKAPEPHKPLHSQARCVCALIRRFLPRLKNEQAWKINVYVHGGDGEQIVKTHNGITSINLKRDVEGFFALNDAEKKRFAYEALREGATIVSDHHGWPTQEILKAFDSALHENLVNEWEFQPKWSPSRKLRAYVKCSHEVDQFQAWMRVEDRAGQLIAEQFLFDEVPDEFCFFPRLGKVRWIDKMAVRLIDRSGEAVADDLHVDMETASA